jgi:hypothetical protein
MAVATRRTPHHARGFGDISGADAGKPIELYLVHTPIQWGGKS